MEHLDLHFSLDQEALDYRAKTKEALTKNVYVKRLLKENGLPEAVIDRNLSLLNRYAREKDGCAKCRGLTQCTHTLRGQTTQLTADETGIFETRFVPCRYQQEKLEAIAHRKYFTISHMSENEYAISLQQIAKTLSSEGAVYVAAYRAMLTSLEGNGACYLYGPPGTGKSTLLMAAANALAKRKVRVAFVRVPLLMNQIKENFDDEDFRRDTLNRLRHVDVLFLDDLGSEMATAWTRDEILFPLLDYRMNARKKTYFASNVEPGDLKERYTMQSDKYGEVASGRLVDRIRTLAAPHRVVGDSRRQTIQ